MPNSCGRAFNISKRLGIGKGRILNLQLKCLAIKKKSFNQILFFFFFAFNCSFRVRILFGFTMSNSYGRAFNLSKM